MSFVNPDAYLPDYPDGFPMSAEEVVEDLRAENRLSFFAGNTSRKLEIC